MTPERSFSTATSVSLDQVAAFRLRRHHLIERAPTGSLARVLGDIDGAQAQVLSAAELSAWARVRDLSPAEVESGLERDRSLVRAWCMRRTLHLLPASDVAIFVRGSARRAEKEVRWVLNRGFSPPVLDRLIDATLSALDAPLTRTELANRVARALGYRTRWTRGAGWGSRRKVPSVQVGKLWFPAYYLLHLAGARGVVCTGPSHEGEATFVRADAWVRPWRDVPVERAEEELLRRYLGAFGPATADDFFAWTQMRRSDAREVWSRIEGELTPVDVEGRPQWVLQRDLNDLEGARLESPTVRLLPSFDTFLLGHEERRHLIDARHHARVYRAQGWISSVILVDGRVAGVWEHETDSKRVSVTLTPFEPLPRSIHDSVQDEAERLARFLEAPAVDVRWTRRPDRRAKRKVNGSTVRIRQKRRRATPS